MTSRLTAFVRFCSLVPLFTTLALGGPAPASAALAPSLSIVPHGAAQLGMIQVRGEGFTPDSAVTLVVVDGDSYATPVHKALVETAVDLDGVFVVWLRETDFIVVGPHGSADPAWILSPGTTSVPRCLETDFVRAYETERDLWTAPVRLEC